MPGGGVGRGGDCGGPLSCGAVCRCVLGTEAVIFLLAAAFRAMFRAMPFSFLSLVVFSTGNALLFSGIRRIRYRRGPPTVRNMRAVQKTGLLVYATHFLRPSVQKTGFWCTEEKFGTGKSLLWYRLGLWLEKQGLAPEKKACRPGIWLKKQNLFLWPYP